MVAISTATPIPRFLRFNYKGPLGAYSGLHIISIHLNITFNS